jgi:hypothetical protein
MIRKEHADIPALRPTFPATLAGDPFHCWTSLPPRKMNKYSRR